MKKIKLSERDNNFFMMGDLRGMKVGRRFHAKCAKAQRSLHCCVKFLPQRKEKKSFWEVFLCALAALREIF